MHKKPFEITGYRLVGLSSKKVYATGSKADCLRSMQKKYPKAKYKQGKIPRLYPEEMQLMEVRNWKE